MVAVLLALTPSCVRRESAVEYTPVADNIAVYWTAAVFFVSDGRGENSNEAFAFVPWFENRMRELSVFEPLGHDEASEAEVTLRLEAHSGNNRVTLRLLVLDARTNASLGEVESLATYADSDAGDFADPKRLVALRVAGNEILDFLKEKRRASVEHLPKTRPKPPPPPLPDGPMVAGRPVCITQCQAPSSSVTTFEEQHRVALGMNETMKSLRDCLDRVGAQLVEPAVLLRFAPEGDLRHMRVDVGGYEQTECVKAIRARGTPSGVRASRASLLRCEYHCSTS
jgi:hypothetical protein